MNSNLYPPDYNGETPFKRWLAISGKIALGLLSRITEQLCEISTGELRPRLLYRGEEVIPIEVFSRSFGISIRTLRRYRGSGKLEYFISKDGRQIFLLQSQFEKFIETNFVCSTDMENNIDTGNGETQNNQIYGTTPRPGSAHCSQ